jgi:hypothetical protein
MDKIAFIAAIPLHAISTLEMVLFPPISKRNFSTNARRCSRDNFDPGAVNAIPLSGRYA